MSGAVSATRLFLATALFASLLLASEANAATKETPSATQLPAKDKKSAEDIMFGNQQNKPAAGMVDDLLTMPERETSSATDKSNEKTKATESHTNSTSANLEGKATQRNNEDDQSKSEEMDSEKEDRPTAGTLDGQKFDYYDYVQETDDSRLPYPSAEGYHLESIEQSQAKANNGNAPGSQSSQPASEAQAYNQRELGGDYPEEDYDGVLYRRKRTPKRASSGGGNALFLRKRGIRSNLDDLLGGNRRRALRLKRDVDFDQFLEWLEMIRRVREQQQLNEMDQSNDDKEMYLYNLKHANDGEWYPSSDDAPQQEAILPPGFLERAAVRELLGEEAESQAVAETIPDWLLRENVPLPNYPLLSRRSQNSFLLPPQSLPAAASPSSSSAKSPFYPLDYRYVMVPGQKKKKRTNAGHQPSFRRIGGGIHLQDLHRDPAEREAEEAEDEAKWGTFPSNRRRPADTQEPDPDRLYALASLLAEDSPTTENGEELERRRRRRATKAGN